MRNLLTLDDESHCPFLVQQPLTSSIITRLLKSSLSSLDVEVRIAAPHAIELILRDLPPPSLIAGNSSFKLSPIFKMFPFNLEDIISHRTFGSSSGNEFEPLFIDISTLEGRKVLLEQKEKLREALELQEGESSNALFEDKDIIASAPSAREIAIERRKKNKREQNDFPLSSSLANEAPPATEPLWKGPQFDLQSGGSSFFDLPSTSSAINTTVTFLTENSPYPLSLLPRLIITTLTNMFHQTWTVRHGTLKVLSLIVPLLVNSCGQDPYYLFVIDLIRHNCLSLLVLDRFTDLTEDRIIAPVREGAAFLFSSLPLLLGDPSLDALVSLCQYEFDWQVRYGGLLLIDELLKKNHAKQTNLVLDPLLLAQRAEEACKDDDDDVRQLGIEIYSFLISLPNPPPLPLLEERMLSLLELTISDPLSEGHPQNISSIYSLLRNLDLKNYHSLLCISIGLLRHSSSLIRKTSFEFCVFGLVDDKIINLDDDFLVTIVQQCLQSQILDAAGVEINDIDFGYHSILPLIKELVRRRTVGAKHLPTLLPMLLSLSRIILSSKQFNKEDFTFLSYSAHLHLLQGEGGPKEWELGFRTADLMIRQPNNNQNLNGRLYVAGMLSQLYRVYKDAIIEKISSSLSSSSLSCGEDHPDSCMSKLVFIVLFGKDLLPSSFKSTTINDDDDDIWSLRLNSLLREDLSPKFVYQHLREEKVPFFLEEIYSTQIIPLLPLNSLLSETLIKMQQPSNPNFPLLLNAMKKANLHSKKCHSSNSDDNTLLLSLREIIFGFKDGKIAINLIISYLRNDDKSLEMEPFLPPNGIMYCLVKEILSKDEGDILLLEHFVISILPLLQSDIDYRSLVIRRFSIISLLKGLFEDEKGSLNPRWASLFLPFILPRLADQESDIRSLSTSTLSLLLRLTPLVDDANDDNISHVAVKKNKKYSLQLQNAIDNSELFLQQFYGEKLSIEDLRSSGHSTDSTISRTASIPNLSIELGGGVKLRPYQIQGVNWLGFLHRSGLHGALCDDMGLGKTLQTICILLHSSSLSSLPSIVVCPSSLVGHWVDEIHRFAPSLGAVQVFSSSNRSTPIKNGAKIVITSYETVRVSHSSQGSLFYVNNTNALRQWNYVVLDEGHIIRNPSTKVTIALKAIRAEHRLLLSGTPIQNSIIELWSLMDFLMPGLLGTEKEFQDKYGRVIMAAQPKALVSGSNSGANIKNRSSTEDSIKEYKDAENALKALHKQVLPFILRRMKEQVLDELPPKIIQDRECDPSPLQVKLFSSFETSGDSSIPDGKVDNDDKMGIFQRINQLRRICLHPCIPEYGDDVSRLSLSDSPKLLLLKELLLECGIGHSDDSDLSNDISSANDNDDNSSNDTGGIHRVLIFVQQKIALSLIEEIVLKRELGLEFEKDYLRLDGSVPTQERHNLAQRFNKDSKISVLLLTTSIGGLGLTLTGADTVVFVEHDWNPMKDLQAMDRAHRLGQKRVVNVYRLIIRDSLEQRIMGLQRWKSQVASAVVKQQSLTADGKGFEEKGAPVSFLEGIVAAEAESEAEKISKKTLPDDHDDESAFIEESLKQSTKIFKKKNNK